MWTHRAVIAEGYGAFTKRKWVRWTKRMREAFLDHLAATCNVRASAEFIGVDPVSVYLLRRKEPGFAAAWGDALALGYEMLETQLVGHALAGDEGMMLTNGADTKMGPVSIGLAMQLLFQHRDKPGKPSRGGPPRQYAPGDQTSEAILAQLARIEARRRKADSGGQAVPALPAPDGTGREGSGGRAGRATGGAGEKTGERA